jgi:hypothetical protein
MSDVHPPTAHSTFKESLYAKDRFTFWPIIIFYIVGFGPLLSGEFWEQNDFFDLGIYILAFIAAVLLAIVYLFRWRWKKCLSVLAAPFVACGVITAQVYFGFDAQWTKFQMLQPYYLWSVQGANYASFEWPEHGLFLGGGWHNTLIYDPTGNTLTDVKNYPSLAKYTGDKVGVRDMGSHFYLVTSSYGM